MRLPKHIYLMATILVASLFIGMFVVGLIEGENYWWSLIPAIFVVGDFVRTVKGVRQEARFQPLRRNAYVTEVMRNPTSEIASEIEFILEEEFKV